jgi:acid phosphatase
VEFFIIDTSPYVQSYRRAPGGYGDLLTQKTDEQTRWLEAALKKSTARWKIVCAHHPIHSSRGKEGDTPELIAQIKPLLEKYGVQAFLNGHEHDLQHVGVGTVNYFCSGAGSKTQPGVRNEHTLFSLGDTGGFLVVSITSDEFRGRFITYNGQEVYAVTLPWLPAAPSDRRTLP